MRRPLWSARIASVCIRGKGPKTIAGNRARLNLLEKVIAALADRGDLHPIDAVLLPAGYLAGEDIVADLEPTERAAVLDRGHVGRRLRRACAVLEPRSPGGAIVLGIDTEPPRQATDGYEQLCVAWRAEGVIGAARKIFPTLYDTRQTRRPIVPRVADYGAQERVIALAGGASALLCACYDAFGVAELPGRTTKRTQAIQFLGQEGSVWSSGEPGFVDLRRQCLESWHALVERTTPRVVLAAIHGFERPGLDGYWQRHGIAAASAALGGLVVGAGHFRYLLPSPDRSTLASAAVPASEVTAGHHRRAHRLQPLSSFVVADDERTHALVRIFDGGSAGVSPADLGGEQVNRTPSA